MTNFLHLYRFGEWLSEQGFNVIHPIKQADASWMQMLGIASSQELNIMLEHYYHFQAPIKAYSPIVTPHIIVALAPILADLLTRVLL